MTAYYNEIDENAAQHLRNLISAGHIAPGDVDTRSIQDVKPDDLRRYTQCHFFAGVGVWSLALRNAGWPDSRRVWTGSCPCQPFSAAGKSAGFDDERHLWPDWFQLIALCGPDEVYGEQVASIDGLAWLDVVHADLEAANYAFGAVDLCAAGVGAPHIRQRLWFNAQRLQHASGLRWEQRRPEPSGRGAVGGCSVGRVADPDHPGLEGRFGMSERANQRTVGAHRMVSGLGDAYGERQGAERCLPTGAKSESSGGCTVDRVDDSERQRLDPRRVGDHAGNVGEFFSAAVQGSSRAGPTNGLWAAADWLLCRDGKWRPVEPGAFPLAHGAPNRVGRLRAYGNAINAKAAEAVIRATM